MLRVYEPVASLDLLGRDEGMNDQWPIFACAFSTSASITGISSAMYAPNFCIADFPTGDP